MRCIHCFGVGAPAFLIAVFFSSLTGTAQTYDSIMENGSSANRVDMIYAGDGYTAAQLGNEYVDQTNTTNDYFFQSTPPFTRYQSFFNAWRVNIASNESGADDPNNNIFVDTALDASYNTGGTDRCLYFNTSKANAAVSTALSGSLIDVDMRLGIVNSSKYGGCGGQWGVWAGANSAAVEIAVHEIGHSFSNLADEYYTSGTWTGGEFGAWNVTNDPDSGKWDRWLGYDDPDSDIGVIDYYEGGRYNEFGVWRPSDNSKMRALNRPFDAISREKFIWDIYQEVDPLDEWLDESTTYSDLDTLWVDSVDSDVIHVEWYIGSVLLQDGGETLDLDALGLAAGDYEIRALAYDTLLDHSFSGDSLDWWRLDEDLLQQSVTWNVSLSAVPEPSAAALILLGLVGTRLRRRRSSI